MTHPIRHPARLGRAPRPWIARLRRVLGLVFVVGGVSAAIGWTGRELWQGQGWHISRIDVRGTHHVSAATVGHLADIPLGSHLLALDLDDAVRGVERHPWIRHAAVRRQFPGRVTITVEEHEPVLLLALDDLWYVDEDGAVFRRADTDDLDYPVLTGVDPALLAAGGEALSRVVERALGVLRAVDGREEPRRDQVSEVHLDPRTGFSLVLRNGSRIVLGFSDPEERLDRLERLFAAGLDLQQPQRVDLGGDTVAIATPLGKST